MFYINVLSRSNSLTVSLTTTPLGTMKLTLSSSAGSKQFSMNSAENLVFGAHFLILSIIPNAGYVKIDGHEEFIFDTHRFLPETVLRLEAVRFGDARNEHFSACLSNAFTRLNEEEANILFSGNGNSSDVDSESCKINIPILLRNQVSKIQSDQSRSGVQNGWIPEKYATPQEISALEAVLPHGYSGWRSEFCGICEFSILYRLLPVVTIISIIAVVLIIVISMYCILNCIKKSREQRKLPKKRQDDNLVLSQPNQIQNSEEKQKLNSSVRRPN